jgi:SAM-dependent methyltransferase
MSWEATAKEWEKLGRDDPFWAVLSNDGYRRPNLSADQLQAFLQSGEDQIEETWQICRRHFGSDFAPRRALDFGCGVGRVALPLARRVEAVIAADVAESMLSVARRVIAEQGVANIELVKCDPALAAIVGPFDLVHSVLVLQHVPAARGLWLTKRLVELAGDGGVGVLHLLYHNPFERSWPARIAHSVVRPLRPWLGRSPEIQMHAYSLNAVMKLLHDAGARQLHVELTNHGGHLGATLFFRARRGVGR